jgi:hypothetical protein
MKKRAYKPLIVATDVAASASIDLGAQFDSLSLQINGSATNSARTITFWQQIDGATYVPIAGHNMSDATIPAGIGTSGKDQVWTFNVEDVSRFKVMIDAITAGTLTISASMTAKG